MFTIKRAIELIERACKVSQELNTEANLAVSLHDLNRLKYINQEAIVLKKIVNLIATVTAKLLFSDEDEFYSLFNEEP